MEKEIKDEELDEVSGGKKRFWSSGFKFNVGDKVNFGDVNNAEVVDRYNKGGANLYDLKTEKTETLILNVEESLLTKVITKLNMNIF